MSSPRPPPANHATKCQKMKNNPPPPFRNKISQKSILTFSITGRSWLNIFHQLFMPDWENSNIFLHLSSSHLFSWSILPFLHAFYHHIRTMLSHFAYLSEILVHCENQWSIQCICYWLWAMGARRSPFGNMNDLMLKLCNLFMSRIVLK